MVALSWRRYARLPPGASKPVPAVTHFTRGAWMQAGSCLREREARRMAGTPRVTLANAHLMADWQIAGPRRWPGPRSRSTRRSPRPQRRSRTAHLWCRPARAAQETRARAAAPAPRRAATRAAAPASPPTPAMQPRLPRPRHAPRHEDAVGADDDRRPRDVVEPERPTSQRRPRASSGRPRAPSWRRRSAGCSSAERRILSAGPSSPPARARHPPPGTAARRTPRGFP